MWDASSLLAGLHGDSLEGHLRSPIFVNCHAMHLVPTHAMHLVPGQHMYTNTWSKKKDSHALSGQGFGGGGGDQSRIAVGETVQHRHNSASKW